jgi:hypothetical protein
MMKWFSLLHRHRTPADSIYYPNANWQVQAASTRCAKTRCKRSNAQLKALYELGVQQLNVNDLASGTENITAEFLENIVAAANALVSHLVGLYGPKAVERAYVYSFDELPEAKIQAIYSIFGAVKKALPGLRTMATLPDGWVFGRSDWIRLPKDLPLDIWVDQYDQVYDAEKLRAVREWTSLPGKQYFWY